MSGAVDDAIGRLMAVFNPPETADAEKFIRELKVALSGLSTDALADGVTELIKTRRHRTFPSIGDIRQSCIDAIPRTYSSPERRDMSVIFRDEDERRALVIAMLASMPQIDRLVADGKHGVLFDFGMTHDRMPETREEWASLAGDFARIEALRTDTLETAPSSDWAHITRTAAQAITGRRERLAEQINSFRAMMKEAAE